MIDVPILYGWDGECLVPCGPVWAKRADQQLVIGECYRMVPVEERSAKTHNHEFAWLHEAWLNLPERLADLYPSPEHLRKRALIEAGYFDEDVIDAGTNAAALRVAVFARKDDFAMVIVRGPLVAVRTAKSQSRRHMDRKTFQDSKAKIMDVVAAMIGTTPESLQRERAA